MTKTTWTCGALLAIGAAALVMTSAPGTARADAEDREYALLNLASAMRDAVNWTKPQQSYSSNSGDQIQDRREYCRNAITEAKAEGLKPGDIIKDSAFKVHPRAKPVGDSYGVKVADLGWFCDDLETRLNYFDLLGRLSYGLYVQGRIDGGLTEDEKRTVTGDQVKTMRDFHQRCVTSLAKELERGLDPAKELELKDGKRLKVSEAGAVCAAFKTHADQQDAAWQVRFAEIAAKYQAVGIKGQRLELFVHYDDVEFYLKGCRSSTSDPKKLKKAKALFQWLTDSSDLITIRKYTFKGDTYKVTEKQFLTEAKAYKGCK